VTEDVTLTIDGKEVTVPAGTLIIRAAERLGVEIPRFCDHPYLAPAGACRQCYVQVEGQPKLVTSCTATVAPGMVVRTQETSEEARQAQVANLEFLLLNHPLDCPVCDRGGECPLQDQAMTFGPGDSRFEEAKRVFRKPIPLSPLVNLDRERCILCARCTRFCDEISGDRFIEMFARGPSQRVAIAAGEDFDSPFGGNTIQICPVGALTAQPYRFVARPFDLRSGDSICGHCSAGCNVRVDLRRDRVVRVLARDHAEVNDAWICDKGRFAFGHADAGARIATPLIRDRGLEPASFGEVMTRVASWVGGARVAILAGGRLLDEDAYALSKLARTVLRTNDLDHRRVDAGAAEAAAASDPLAVTYRDVEAATTIVVVGLDAEQEVPILHLRLRKAARRGARIVVVHPRRTRLHDVTEHVLVAPGSGALGAAARGEATGVVGLDDAVASLRAAGGDGIVIAGERYGRGATDAMALARRTGARFAYVTRRANDRGALRAGVHPRLLPGGRSVLAGAERAEVEAVWGPIMVEGEGRDAGAILRACAHREVDVLFLVGVDPLRDHPDAGLARRALENAGRKVVQSLELGSLEPYADAFLPAASWIERDGHVTDWEGRGQRVHPVRAAPGLARPDWELFAMLALAAGGDLGFETLEDLHAEMGPLLAPRTAEVPVTTAAAADDEGAGGGDGLILFTYPLLVDEGRMAAGAPELHAALGTEAFVELHPDEAGRAGVSDGGRATVRTDAGAAELPVRVTDGIAPGTAFVPFNSAGLAANRLLSGAFHTRATIEPAATDPVAAEPEAGTGAESRASAAPSPPEEPAAVGGGS
jgi:NADH-quinone oxidoreductase subunit G